jgi:DNA-binding transcriptional ArsR family regulator
VDTLNVTFLALSDPTRRVILDRLRKGAATVNELAEPFGVSQQAISKHLAYLERASLVEKRKEGREQFCSLRAAPLEQAFDWMDDYRQFWDGALNRLDGLLQELRQPQRLRRKRHVRKRR